MDSVTYRPVGARVVVWACTCLLIIIAVVIGRSLPDEMKFRPSETATIIVMLAGIALGAHAIGRSRVTVEQQGLTVVNGFKRRELYWEQITVISMKPGAPWPTIETINDERFILFGIQGSDHRQTRQALERIKAHLQ